MDRGLSGRRQNRRVTNPSKGLLPQLVDVLYALADSQELLAHRIRTAHLEFLGVHPSGCDESWPSPTLSPRRSAEFPLVTPDSIPARAILEQPFPESSEFSVEPSGDPTDSNSDLAVGSGVTLNEAELVTPPVSPTETPMPVPEHDAPQNASPRQPHDPQITPPRDAPTIEPGEVSYNFFDELDSRLADLGDSGNGSPETKS